MWVRVTSSFLVKGDDEMEGVEFLEVAVASSRRFREEANSFRHLSRLTMKLVMPN